MGISAWQKPLNLCLGEGVLGVACLGFVCLPPSCTSFPRSSRTGEPAFTSHGAAMTFRLRHSKAKAVPHTQNAKICYFHGWKSWAVAHPCGTGDTGSLLRHGTGGDRDSPAWHPDPQDEVLLVEESSNSQDNCCALGVRRSRPAAPQKLPPIPPRTPRPGDFPFSCKQMTHPSHSLLQRRAAEDNEHQACPPHTLPLNPFREHVGPPPADHRSGLHNGKSMQKYFSHNAFQIIHTQPAMLIGSEALLREFNSLFQAPWAGEKGNSLPLSLLLAQGPTSQSVELVLEEIQAERSSNKAELGFRDVCTYSYD